MSQPEKQQPKRSKSACSCDSCQPRWYSTADDAFLCQLRKLSGFTRKARTPRPQNKAVSPVVVPELETSEDQNSEEKDEERLLRLVPTHDVSNNSSGNCLVGLLPSDMDLAEFAADMESLLGGALDNSFYMKELGDDRQLIKEELDSQNTDGDTNFTLEEEDDQCESRKKVGLRLDYEALIAEWSVQGSGSPWMSGERPQFGPDNCWLDCTGMEEGGEKVQGLADEGREARVSRYREKRRTRLFSKKIRYEVRKLNAEKRPRMKGRFVKRASFAGATATA